MSEMISEDFVMFSRFEQGSNVVALLNINMDSGPRLLKVAVCLRVSSDFVAEVYTTVLSATFPMGNQRPMLVSQRCKPSAWSPKIGYSYIADDLTLDWSRLLALVSDGLEESYGYDVQQPGSTLRFVLGQRSYQYQFHRQQSMLGDNTRGYVATPAIPMSTLMSASVKTAVEPRCQMSI